MGDMLLVSDACTADLGEVMQVMGEAFDPLYGEAWTEAQCAGIMGMPGTWLLVAYVSRYSSLAALVAAAAAPLFAALMHGATNQTLVVGLLGMALIGKHWQNIQRLLAGQESKIGGKKKP